jgi:protein SMG8
MALCGGSHHVPLFSLDTSRAYLLLN